MQVINLATIGNMRLDTGSHTKIAGNNFVNNLKTHDGSHVGLYL